MTLKEQVDQALAAWLTAQTKATDAAAAYLELKAIIGANEAERKAARAKLPPDEYEQYALHCAQAEQEKAAAAAIAERMEKTLNVLREELNHHAAELQLKASEKGYESALLLVQAFTQPQVRPIPAYTGATQRLVPIPGIDDDPNAPPF